MIRCLGSADLLARFLLHQRTREYLLVDLDVAPRHLLVAEFLGAFLHHAADLRVFRVGDKLRQLLYRIEARGYAKQWPPGGSSNPISRWNAY